MDVKLGESSGVDAPRKKITFFAPAAFRGFLGVRGCAPGFPFFVSPRDRTGMFSCPFRKLDISSTITFSAGRINPADMYD
jgi:hypothetical protein